MVYIYRIPDYNIRGWMCYLSLSAISGGIEIELLLLIGFGLFIFGKWIYDKRTTNHYVFTGEELEAMNREMIGKTTKECQQILKRYSK